ncbi:hypothetical protein Tco_0927788 [Tanacetum coccineum]
MECNKDEATRAKEIAKSKFSSKDLNGAKKFALKAQNLFPGLEGISQLLAVLDVHVAAKSKVMRSELLLKLTGNEETTNYISEVHCLCGCRLVTLAPVTMLFTTLTSGSSSYHRPGPVSTAVNFGLVMESVIRYAYHYDVLLLGIMMIRKKMVKCAKD